MVKVLGAVEAEAPGSRRRRNAAAGRNPDQVGAVDASKARAHGADASS